MLRGWGHVGVDVPTKSAAFILLWVTAVGLETELSDKVIQINEVF